MSIKRIKYEIAFGILLNMYIPTCVRSKESYKTKQVET